MVRNGYSVPFRVRPPLTLKPPLWLKKAPQDRQKLRFLQDEVSAMLSKGAIEEVSSSHPRRGFFSRLFLVRKRNGGWRPVINLSRLNRFVQTPHFRMETLDSMRLALRKGDWVASLDLKDAYFHVPIHPMSRRYLRFFFRGKTYKFVALYFGLSTALYVFTHLVKAVVRHCRRRLGLRLHTYLDDWLQPSRDVQASLDNLHCLLKLVLQLGFIPNWDKSDLVPSQIFVFLGASISTREALVGPSLDLVTRLQEAIHALSGQEVASARQIHSLLGQMESLSRLLPQGRSHKRLLQWWVKDH